MDKAKHHLKKSGLEGAKFDMSTSDTAYGGAVLAAQLFAEHWQKIGLQPIHDRGRLLGQAFGVGDDDLDLAAENAARGVEVLLGDQYSVAHRFASDDRTGRRQGREPPDGGFALGERCRAHPKTYRRSRERYEEWSFHWGNLLM